MTPEEKIELFEQLEKALPREWAMQKFFIHHHESGDQPYIYISRDGFSFDCYMDLTDDYEDAYAIMLLTRYMERHGRGGVLDVEDVLEETHYYRYGEWVDAPGEPGRADFKPLGAGLTAGLAVVRAFIAVFPL